MDLSSSLTQQYDGDVVPYFGRFRETSPKEAQVCSRELLALPKANKNLNPLNDDLSKLTSFIQSSKRKRIYQM